MISIRQSLTSRLLARRAVRLMLALFALIIAIFITDIFTSELEAVLKNGGHFGDFAWLMLLKTPNVVDFALPIVLFLGLFFAIQGARTDNELVICAAAGEPWYAVPRTAIAFGLGAMVVSLTFSGLVVPWSSYALRLSFHELVTRQFIDRLTEPQERLSVQEIDGRIVIAAPVDGAARGRLFVFSAVPDAPQIWRAALARDWAVTGPDAAGSYQLELQGFREIQGYNSGSGHAPGSTPGSTPGSAPALMGGEALALSRLNVSRLSLDFQLDSVVEAADAERQSSERFLFAEGGPQDGLLRQPDGTLTAAPTRALGEMLARALLGLVAASVAVAAAAFAATRSGRWIALPVGLVAVMAADIGSRAILGDAAGLGYPRFWVAFAALSALGLAPAMGYVALRGEALVTPARDQA